MPGFQSLAQRAMAQPPRRYADGGLVDDFTAQMEQQRQSRRQAGLAEAASVSAWSESEAQKAMAQQSAEFEPLAFADGGPVGFGARGLAGLRDMVPKMAAMGYPQAAAPGAAAALSAPPRSPAGLRAVIPQVEAMGYQQASAPAPQYFAGGGMVRGPGTGTSDSVPDEVEPGTFIMPADSTEAIGPSALEQMGTVPVRLSDGEMKLPPEQVMAIGEAVLKLMKDATHVPVNGQDGGQTDAEVADQPEQRFADGGLVDQPRRPNSFGDAAAVARDPSVTQVNTGGGDTFGRPTPAPAARPAGLQPAAARMASTTDPTNPYAANNAAVLSNFAAQQGSRGVMEMGRPAAPQPPTAPNSFGDAAAATRDPQVTQVQYTPGAAPAPLAARAPAAPAVGQPAGFTAAARMASPAPMGWAERQAQRNDAVSAASITNRPEWSRAPAGLARRGYADGGVVEDDLQRKLAQIPTGGPAGWNGGGGPPVPSPAEQALSTRVNQIPAGAPAGFTGGGGSTGAPAPLPAAPAGPLSRAATLSPPAAAPVSTPAARALSAPPAGLVTREGNSYSGGPNITGDITVNGLAPRGGAVSAQNQAAAESLAGRSAQESAARVMGTMPAGFGGQVQPPTVLHSGNDWQSRQDLKNAATSAASITNNGSQWDRNKGESQASLTYRALLGNDMAARGAVPRLAAEAMQETGANRRAALADAGASERALIAERGQNTRADIQAQGLTLKAMIDARKSGQPPAGYRWAANGTSLEAIPGGPAADGKPLTEDQAKSAGYALRMDNALKLIDDIGKNDKGAIRPGLVTSAINSLPEAAANALRSTNRQRVEAAQLDALDAALTLNTGAAYTREQLQGLSRSYFAQPNDDDATVADKANRLQSLIDTARLRAGEKGASMTDAAQAKNAARTAPGAAAAPVVPAQVAELQRRAANNPALAARLKEAGY